MSKCLYTYNNFTLFKQSSVIHVAYINDMETVGYDLNDIYVYKMCKIKSYARKHFLLNLECVINLFST